MNQTITIGKRTFDILHFSGKVVKIRKDYITETEGSSTYIQGSGSFNVHSKTTLLLSLYLIDKNGTEKLFKLKDQDIDCREGNVVTISQATEFGQKNCLVFAVHNHSTGESGVWNSKIQILVMSGTKTKKEFGCFVTELVALVVIAIITGIILLWQIPLARLFLFLLVIGLVLYFVYLAKVKVPMRVKMFKQAVEYPKIELW